MRTIERQVLSVVVGVLLFGQPAASEDRLNLAGTWKLVSFFTEDVQSKARNHIYGEHPQGALSITPGGRFFSFASADWRRFARAPSAQIEFRSIFYAGTYRLDGNRFIITTESAWNEGWEGADPFDISWSEGWVSREQVRFFRVETSRSENTQLRMETGPILNPNGTGNTIVGTMIWTRE
jgi:hypothetical protein